MNDSFDTRAAGGCGWLALLLVLGCSSGADPGPNAGSGSSNAAQSGTAQGGTTNPCARAVTTAVGWDEDTLLGAPATVFAGVAGTCKAPVALRSELPTGVSVPVTADSNALTVSLDLDQNSAQLKALPGQNAEPQLCGELTIKGHVSLHAADGSVDDQGEVTLHYSAQLGRQPFDLRVAARDHQGSLRIDLPSGQQGTLVYALDGAGPSCAGEIRLETTQAKGNAQAGAIGTIGAWSSTGCELGQTPFDAGSDAGASPLRDAIAQQFGDAAYAVAWDGEPPATTLRLALEVVAEDTLCRDAPPQDVVQVPVRATFGTEDGTLASHTADGSIRATIDSQGHVRMLELWIDETERCSSESDTLSYALSTCATLDRVELQLGVNYDAVQGVTSPRLEAYETDRRSMAPPGAADRVRRLAPPQ